MILQTDKGNATVVTDHTDYERKIKALLEDKQTYSELKKDPAPGLERKVNMQLLSLNKKGSIPDALYMHLRSPCRENPSTLWPTKNTQTRGAT